MPNTAKLRQFLRSELFKNFYIYSLGSAFRYGVSFFLMPVYTRVFTTAEYGQIELLNSFTTVLSLIIGFGFPQLLSVEYYHLNRTERATFINNIIGFYFILSVPLSVAALFVGITFKNILFGHEAETLVVIIAICTVFFTFFQSIYFVTLQMSKRAMIFSFNQVFLGLLLLLLNIILICHYKYGILGLFFSSFVVIILSTLIAGFEYFKKIRRFVFHLNISLLFKYLYLSLPFVMGVVSVWLINGIDRWIILHYLREDEVGIYAIASKFALVYYPLVITPITSSLGPIMFERYSKCNYDQKLLYTFLFTAVLFSFSSFITPIIARYIIDPKFYAALPLMPYLILSAGVFLLTQIIGTLLLYSKQTNILIANIVATSVLNILLNILLVPTYKLYGAVYANLTGYVFWLILILYQNNNIKVKLINKTHYA